MIERVFEGVNPDFEIEPCKREYAGNAKHATEQGGFRVRVHDARLAGIALPASVRADRNARAARNVVVHSSTMVAPEEVWVK